MRRPIVWPKDSVATRFMHTVFVGIRHGNKRHRNWLERKCIELINDFPKLIPTDKFKTPYDK